MHLKLFVPVKQIAVRGYAWLYFVARYKSTDHSDLDYWQWEFTIDEPTATRRLIEANRKVSIPDPFAIIGDVVLVQYADEPMPFLPIGVVMNTTPFQIVALGLLLRRLTAEVINHYTVKS